MFILPITCILTGCLTDVELRDFNRITDNPVQGTIEQIKKQNPVEGIKPACYIDGLFYRSCPE